MGPVQGEKNIVARIKTNGEMRVGAAHLGGTLRPDRTHLMNSFWMFAAGVVLGAITVRKKGNLLPAIAAHSARNATEFAAMFFALALN